MSIIYNPYNPNNVPITKNDVNNILSKVGLDYKIKSVDLFQQAFVHSSYVKRKVYTNQATGEISILADKPADCMDLQETSYERLEFLGDKELDKAITNYVFMRFKTADEHFLTKLRSRIVNNDSIGELAKKIGLGKFLVISKKLEGFTVKSGKEVIPFRENLSKLSDIFEAFIGALWLDSFDSNLIYTFVKNLIEKHIDIVELISQDNNFKEIFQTHCQKTYGYIPIYKDVDTTGSGIHKIYTVSVCSPEGKVFAVGSGGTKQAAQKEACRIALSKV